MGETIMKAVIFNEFGGKEKLALTALPTPQPAEDEVLIRIKAAGVNPVDWKIREGWLKDLMPKWKAGTPAAKSF
jgi:NADPH:quinone reductase-like Zn-dependent oxidoreductase